MSAKFDFPTIATLGSPVDIIFYSSGNAMLDPSSIEILDSAVATIHNSSVEDMLIAPGITSMDSGAIHDSSVEALLDSPITAALLDSPVDCMLDCPIAASLDCPVDSMFDWN